jgi:hypothetical protein
MDSAASLGLLCALDQGLGLGLGLGLGTGLAAEAEAAVRALGHREAEAGGALVALVSVNLC